MRSKPSSPSQSAPDMYQALKALLDSALDDSEEFCRALLGCDLKCRACGLVRYPDGWAKVDPRRVDGGKAL